MKTKEIQTVSIEESSRNETKEKMDRRNFLKTGVAGAALGITGIMAKKNELSAKTTKAVSKIAGVELDEFPNKITDKCKPFEHKNTVFARLMWDPKMKPAVEKRRARKKFSDEPGDTQLDMAVRNAGWSLEYRFAEFSMNGQPDTDAYQLKNWHAPKKYKFKDSSEAAQRVKRAARFLGADLVGISKYEPLWTYSTMLKIDKYQDKTPNRYPRRPMALKPVKTELPFVPKSVIVMAVEMDYAGISASPSYLACGATGQGYSKMAALGSSMVRFFGDLGYKSFANGNDTTLSVPYAVAAGLGELGRNGLLVTRELGPRLRLVKVFTELEIKSDKPKDFGIKEFCKRCKRCAEACPSKAISMDDEPTLKGPSISNCNGVEKWYIDPEKCYSFWAENGKSCANCIASCPFNKPQMWNHSLINSMTAIPVGSLHYVMARMDKIFGYGNTFDKSAMTGFWKKED